MPLSLPVSRAEKSLLILHSHLHSSPPLQTSPVAAPSYRNHSPPRKPDSSISYYADTFRALTWQRGPKTLIQTKQLHAQILLAGLAPTAYLASKVIALYCGSNDLPSAERVFRQVIFPSPRLFNSLIRGYSIHGLDDEVLIIFREMHYCRLQPDHFSFPFVLKSCAKLEFLFLGTCFHSLCGKLGFEYDIYVSTSLVDMYVKCGKIDIARRMFELTPVRDVSTWNAMISGYMKVCELRLAQELFDEMPDRNIISWTSMICGYSQNGVADRALALFEEMMRGKDGVKPNWITLMSVLPACAQSSALEYGERLHEYAKSMGVGRNPSLLIAFSAMYSRCGNLVKARNCFDQLSDIDRNVIAWNTMISGYSLHGQGSESVAVFEEMIKSGTRPDEITFIGLLSGCSHSGLLDLGLMFFKSMERIYSVKPKLQHYACVVDLLGRAGLLEEAKKFIEKMPLQPCPSVWGALLAGCRRHRDLLIGEIAAKQLFKLEPENTGNFVLLSNMYAEERMWEQVGTVRSVSKGKNPGCSWIELHGKVHSFLSGDKSHQQAAIIYEFLEEIYMRIRREGFIPNTTLVLHDVSEEEKEFNLMTHSEKLAVAFGLLKTAPGDVIRVTKNLRICDDCHSAFKCISVAYDREIIVRDINRFHHFEKGSCSCGDYW